MKPHLLLLAWLVICLVPPLTARAWVIGGFEIPAAPAKARPVKTGTATGSVSGNSAPAAGATFTEPVTGMEFVWIPGGCFQMGSPPDEKCRYDDEGPVHKVCVEGYWMGKYEVTNGEYRKFKPGHDSGFCKPSGWFKKRRTLNDDQQPVVKISWEDAVAFAEWLSRHSRFQLRLPTEAEWGVRLSGGSHYGAVLGGW